MEREKEDDNWQMNDIGAKKLVKEIEIEQFEGSDLAPTCREIGL